jgi:hypothetical protein
LPYHVKIKFIYSNITDAINKAVEWTQLPDWITISIGTPTSKTFSVQITRIFASLADARNWIQTEAGKSGFESTEVTYTKG